MVIQNSKSYAPQRITHIIKNGKIYYAQESRGADRFYAAIYPSGEDRFLTSDSRNLLAMR